MSDQAYVALTKVGSVASIVIDRGQRRNALTDAMVRSLNAHLAAVASDGSVTGLIVTGVDGAFCAGADLDMVKANTAAASEETREYIEAEGQAIIRGLVDLPIPTIAAVDGPALGLGFDMALACDQLVIGPAGWCMQGWGRLGLVDGTGGSLLLRTRNSRALWRLLADQPRIDGRLGVELGIAEASSDRPARDVALERMSALGHLSRRALAAYVEVQRAPIRAELDQHLARSARVQADLLTAPEFGSAVANLMARRPTVSASSRGEAHA